MEYCPRCNLLQDRDSINTVDIGEGIEYVESYICKSAQCRAQFQLVWSHDRQEPALIFDATPDERWLVIYENDPQEPEEKQRMLGRDMAITEISNLISGVMFSRLSPNIRLSRISASMIPENMTSEDQMEQWYITIEKEHDAFQT
jgi:hypothetical protein